MIKQRNSFWVASQSTEVFKLEQDGRKRNTRAGHGRKEAARGEARVLQTDGRHHKPSEKQLHVGVS